MCAFDGWTRRGFAGKSAGTKAVRLYSSFTFQWAGLLANLGLVASAKPQIFNCGLLGPSEVFTETGPGHHEGNSGVSVKPPLPASPAAQPRACQEFLVTFVSQTKVTRPSACEASGAKPLLTSGTLASARENCRACRAKPLLILETLASASTNSQQAGRSHINLQRILRQQNRAFNRTLAVSRKTGPPAAARAAKTKPRHASFDHRPPHGNNSYAVFCLKKKKKQK